MVNQFYSTPSIDPLHRLNVRDGLEVNAERWELAHRYHKHRQNIHYQSLNEPGIVCGLGIQIIEAPQTSRANLHKQGRWLKIQPGIAIDIEGNPIIVDENKSIDRSFPFVSPRISNKNFDEEITVYLVVSYVDSRRLTDEEYWKTDKERWKEREWFRFDQQLEPPNERQIELCRIKLLVEDIALDRFELKKPQNVFNPRLNEIDLRYRPSAKAKPQALVNIATTAVESYNPRFPTSNINHNLTCLMQSLDALYPSLQGNTEVVNINLEETFNLENIDLLHIPFGQIQNLYRSSNNDGKYFLNSYWEKGGVILIEADSKIEGNSQNITSDINSLFKSLDKNYVYLKEWGSDDLDKEDSLKNQPFLFTALPLTKLILSIYYSPGIIVVHGNLSDAWGGKSKRYEENLSRDDIRTAHELGINMLYFAYRRRKMMGLIDSDI